MIRRIAPAFLLASSLCACSRAPQAPVAAAAPAPPVVAAPAAPPPPPPPRELPDDATSLPPADRDYLVAQGLVGPEAELIADLRAHPELIACQGSVGGTYGFHDPEAIHVLSRNQVEAGFDDGHDAGHVDLSFTVRHGKIGWKVEKTDCTTQDRVANAGPR
jgi:hypothetical protein